MFWLARKTMEKGVDADKQKQRGLFCGGESGDGGGGGGALLQKSKKIK
jgi:hypothetical protein